MKKSGSRYTVDYDADNQTLSHEIVHSYTDWPYYRSGAMGWFTEGLAEYVGLTYYRSGIYMPSKTAGYVKEYVTGYGKDGNGGRALGEDIRVGSLKSFMLMPYTKFTGNAMHCYGVGALLVTYFCDLERDEELENLQNFLKALKAGKEGEEALEVLLNGRSFEELESSIRKAWKSKGVTLEFQ